MSQRLINRSPDLKKLRDEGYEIAIVSGFLVVRDVPYVNSKQEVKLADLVSELVLSQIPVNLIELKFLPVYLQILTGACLRIFWLFYLQR